MWARGTRLPIFVGIPGVVHAREAAARLDADRDRRVAPLPAQARQLRDALPAAGRLQPRPADQGARRRRSRIPSRRSPGSTSSRSTTSPTPRPGAQRLAAAEAREDRTVSEQAWDFVIVGGGSAGCALANRLSADPSTRVLVLEAGRPDYRWDVFIHMPAGLAFPIGNRFYDWKYESEPEPHMNGRRIYHARGKVLGGSSSINGMIFQRGNPLDYERWATVPGHRATGTTRTACRTSSAWRPASPAPTSGAAATARSCSSAGRPRTRCSRAFFEAVQQAGYPLTDDVNGYRQEGFARFDRNIHRGRRLSAARAYLHPVMQPAEPRGALPHARHARAVRRARARSASRSRASAAPRSMRANEVILCGGAINSPQLLQLSGVGNAARARGARHRRRARPARRRRAPAGSPRGVRPVRAARSRSRCSRR